MKKNENKEITETSRCEIRNQLAVWVFLMAMGITKADAILLIRMPYELGCNP